MFPSFDSLTPVRFIKLGRGSAWARRSLENGEIHFGHSLVPHDLAKDGDRAAIVSHLIGLGRTAGKAADFAREIVDFYTLGPEAIWITFENGRLWWARAEPEVIWVGQTEEQGARIRRTIGGWSNKDALGTELRQDSLSSKLTGVAAYRQTLCEVKAAAYLLRKLAAEAEPLVQVAQQSRNALLASAADLIAALHWIDFETLIDLILARNGWHRTSTLGGTMKDADLVVEQSITAETALVQVKSSASQAVLDDYIKRFDDNPSWTRLIFVCHSPKGIVAAPSRSDVIVWTRQALADAAIRNGLFDWLIARAA